jgi:DNA-binding NarL/FixJ family response regulator
MDKKDIEELYKQGLSLRRIGELVNLSRTSVHTYIIKHKITKGVNTELASAIRDKVEKGWTIKLIAKHYNINPVTVWSHLKRIGTSVREIKKNLTNN